MAVEPGERSETAEVAEGWALRRIVGPRSFAGSNGMRFAPDGRLWVCSCFGGELGSVDIESGERGVVVPVGGPLVTPDDLDFDSRGFAYVTEYGHARVSEIDPGGRLRRVAEDLPGANGVTVFEDRIFVDEARATGDLVEIFRDGQPHRLIASGIPFPNALGVGADRRIYFPIMQGEVWRVPLEGGEVERFATDLGGLNSVKFDSRGRLHVCRFDTREVLVFDISSGDIVERLQGKFAIDNVAISEDGRVFTSHFVDGEIDELLTDGSRRTIMPPGLMGPWGLAVVDGTLTVADGLSLVAVGGDGTITRTADYSSGFHWFSRDLAEGPGGAVWVTTSAGDLLLYEPGGGDPVVAPALEEPVGVAAAPNGAAIVAEAGSGRVLRIERDGKVSTIATGLDRPSGVACAPDGGCYVCESGRGRIVRIDRGTRVVADGLGRPQGLTCAPQGLIAVDAGRREIILASPEGRTATTIAHLPSVGGAPLGATRETIPGLPDVLPGPLTQFAGIATDADGTIYIAGDADGTIYQLQTAYPSHRDLDVNA